MVWLRKKPSERRQIEHHLEADRALLYRTFWINALEGFELLLQISQTWRVLERLGRYYSMVSLGVEEWCLWPPMNGLGLLVRKPGTPGPLMESRRRSLERANSSPSFLSPINPLHLGPNLILAQRDRRTESLKRCFAVGFHQTKEGMAAFRGRMKGSESRTKGEGPS